MKAVRLLAITAAIVFCASAWPAEQFPTKPIRFVLPQAPGGIADVTCRMVAQKMSESLGQQVLIDNRPSAGAVVAAEMVAKSEADGYTLMQTGSGTASAQTLFKKLPYSLLDDFSPVSILTYFDFVVLVSVDSKFNSITDVIAHAKHNPGKLNIGTINIGSGQFLAAELFKSMAGINAQTVPFKGTPAVITALRGNELQLAVETLYPVFSQIKGRTLKALALTSSRRFPTLPDLPTLAESGVPGYEATSWNGMSAPAKTPRAVIERLNRAVVAALNLPEIRQKLLDIGAQAGPTTPEVMRKRMAADVAKWKKVIEDARIQRQ